MSAQEEVAERELSEFQASALRTLTKGFMDAGFKVEVPYPVRSKIPGIGELHANQAAAVRAKAPDRVDGTIYWFYACTPIAKSKLIQDFSNAEFAFPSPVLYLPVTAASLPHCNPTARLYRLINPWNADYNFYVASHQTSIGADFTFGESFSSGSRNIRPLTSFKQISASEFGERWAKSMLSLFLKTNVGKLLDRQVVRPLHAQQITLPGNAPRMAKARKG